MNLQVLSLTMPFSFHSLYATFFFFFVFFFFFFSYVFFSFVALETYYLEQEKDILEQRLSYFYRHLLYANDNKKTNKKKETSAGKVYSHPSRTTPSLFFMLCALAPPSSLLFLFFDHLSSLAHSRTESQLTVLIDPNSRASPSFFFFFNKSIEFVI